MFFFLVTEAKDAELVRCYCNQPDCVSQSYLCMGRGCFTELPSSLNPASLRPEHSPYSGCLEKSLKERQCSSGYLCCEEDLCNHIDSPAVRSRLNKTLQGRLIIIFSLPPPPPPHLSLSLFPP